MSPRTHPGSKTTYRLPQIAFTPTQMYPAAQKFPTVLWSPPSLETMYRRPQNGCTPPPNFCIVVRHTCVRMSSMFCWGCYRTSANPPHVVAFGYKWVLCVFECWVITYRFWRSFTRVVALWTFLCLCDVTNFGLTAFNANLSSSYSLYIVAGNACIFKLVGKFSAFIYSKIRKILRLTFPIKPFDFVFWRTWQEETRLFGFVKFGR